ncbi:alpha/beta fold hydrolase [Macrococcus sp. EM39E]|uniref:alpha/beta fold hydrolase n=1 Tax=Macrococcus animalis TaxID=3395467 RepID=UPI0039BDA85F
MKFNKKMGCVFFLILSMGCIAFISIGYFQRNKSYIQAPLTQLQHANFKEEQFMLPDGDTINYGTNNNKQKPALLLIHGQGMQWQDYAKVLPELGKHYQIYGIDCYGHGKSSWNKSKYTGKAHADDLHYFIQHVIKREVTVAGHSSGGLIVAYLASKYPDDVSGLVLEDPPFFSTEKGRIRNTFSYQYGFKLYHDFKQQPNRQDEDFFAYSLKHNYFKSWFPKILWNKMSKDAIQQHKRNPNKPVHLTYLPPEINRLFEAETYPFDYAFGEGFYDNSWFIDYDHADILKGIKANTIFLKAQDVTENGILIGALTQKDAKRVVTLIHNSKLVQVDTRDHDIHYTKPDEFIRAIQSLKK